MGKHISQKGGTFEGEFGVENFGPDSLPQPGLKIPVVDELPSPTFTSSQVVFVRTSGVIAYSVEGVWKTKAYDGAKVVYPAESGFSPLDSRVSGTLVAWYDATESPITKTGSGITQWDDLSPNGYDLGIAYGTPAHADDGGVSGVFLGNQEQFSNDNGPSLDIDGVDQPVTVVACVRMTEGVTGSPVYFMIWDSASNANGIFCYYNSATSEYAFFKRDTVSTQVGLIEGYTSATNKEVITSWHGPGGTAGSAVSGCIFASGVAQQVAVSGMDIGTLGTTERWRIGGLDRPGFGTGNWLNGFIYSLAVFSSGLSDEHRSAIERNFAVRYNVPMRGNFEELP